MDTKKLRQKILDLAIHGKLVPQDPNDEPASVLLDRIRAEKERLIKEGKIKRPKKSASSDMPHYGNVPFEIPEVWCWTTVGELLLNRDEERIPLSSDIRKKQTHKIYDYYGAAGIIDKVDSYLFDERLLLVGEDGANLLSRAKNNAFFADGKYWVNNHAHILDCTDKSILDYVAFVINATDLKSYISGSAQPKFNQENLNKVSIPLPPLHEQKRIIDEIKQYFALIDAIEKAQRGLSDLVRKAKSRILDLAISGKLVPQDPADEPAIELLKRINPAFKPCDNAHYPYVIPENWQFVALGDITTFLSRGKSPKYSEEKRYPVFAQKCNQWEGITLEKVQYLEPDTLRKWPDEYKLQDGDVLVNSTGTGTLGRTGIFYTRYLGDYPFILPDSHVTVIRGNKVLISQEYLYLVSRSAYMQKWMADNMVGSTNQKELYPKALEGFLLALPPRAEQDRIVSFAKMIFGKVKYISMGL